MLYVCMYVCMYVCTVHLSDNIFNLTKYVYICYIFKSKMYITYMLCTFCIIIIEIQFKFVKLMLNY